jgi:hypothetical protein
MEWRFSEPLFESVAAALRAALMDILNVDRERF